MSTNPPGWTPTVQAIEKKATDRSDRDETLALEVLKQAVINAKDANKTARAIADDAEIMWKWVTTDQWPPREEAP